MSVLSITFHSTENISKEWEDFTNGDLHQMVENLVEAEKYILSEVQSDMISEGKNTNLLLFFENEEKRTDFVEIELINITEHIQKRFSSDVMIFKTYLNPKKSRI